MREKKKSEAYNSQRKHKNFILVLVKAINNE